MYACICIYIRAYRYIHASRVVLLLHNFNISHITHSTQLFNHANN